MNKKLLCATIVFTCLNYFQVRGETDNLTVNLSNTGINNLSVNFINPNSVKKLILRKNQIKGFEEGFFTNYPQLEHLDLSENQIKINEFFSLKGMSNLKYLILDYNNYINNETEASETKDLGDEDSLSRMKNNITSLYVSTMFPELTHISLRKVHLHTLSEKWHQQFPKLKYLDLSENILDEATLSLFLRNLPASITHLVLEKVGLIIVRSEQLNAIESLNLNHNYFPKLTSRKCYEQIVCLENMDNLRVLSVSNCSIVYIEETAFRYMKNLIELDISNNHLRQLPEKTFSNLPGLEKLDLSQNPFHTMPSINVLQNLTSLVMDGMKVDFFTSSKISIFLPNLKSLSLRENKLTIVPLFLFNNLPMLETLDLSHNELTSLPSWETQKFLRQLNLNFNNIEVLDNLHLKNAKSLEVLHLKNNSISKIKVAFLKNLPNNDVIMDL